MEYFDAVESEWTTVPINTDDALSLQAAGERLVATESWWGASPTTLDGDTAELIARSAVHCRMTAGGNWQVRVADRIGIVATGEVGIRVRPKIPFEHALYLMRKGHAGLSAAMNVDDARVVADVTGGFWELICHSFVREAERVVSRDLIRDYELESEQLAVVRGRLQMAPTARRMLQGALRFNCEFEDYSPDVPINRYLKAASGVVVRAPILSPDLRRRAMRVRAQMTNVGELLAGDRRAILIDRRTAHYRDATQLADLVLAGQGETWRAGASLGVAYLIRTPLLMQRGLQQVLSEAFGPSLPVRPEKVALGGIPEWINPDLVFGQREAVADVKYKRATDVWNRPDLYEVTAFAAHLRTTRAAIFDFGPAQRPAVEVGDIRVSHLHWDVSLDDPARASSEFVHAVEGWLRERPEPSQPLIQRQFGI